MDIVPILLQLVLVVFLIFMNGFFVAAEFACVKIRPSRLETLIQEGSKRAAYAKRLTDHLDASLSVTQLGITLASLGLGWVGEPAVATLILPVTQAMGIDATIGHTISLVLAFSIITAGHIILGELTPKTMAIQSVEKIMLAVALPMLIFHKVMYPFVWLLNHVANWVTRRMGFEAATEGENAHTEEEIRLLMEESHRQGLIDDTEANFVDNVFDFTELNVREIMTPRTDMVVLYLEDSFEDNLAIIMEEQLTRYPICREDKDHIIGFLHVKDLMKLMVEGKKPNLRKLARKALVVPESMDVNVLLKTMQGSHSQLAIVVDEFGGTAGMVTIEDIVEEIVGDIQDEFDEERPTAEARGNHVYSVDAKMLLEELEDILEIKIEDEDVDSVGGWLYDQIGGEPQVGQMAAAAGNLLFVEEVDGARITRVLVKLENPLTEEHEEIV
ncbi:HlyC/CorC family transporter [Selenomonas caprae]|uniref:Hemolysin, contains CBS domains n=2 Tax=Selenomonas TaxID=970 RepID=A0A1I3G3L7_SELRU|nr:MULTISPECIES: hemolysin family protein [Selenomonas]MBQ1890248.1 HlyC/CorC family transporter [Selenomonas sp.]TYZ28229.1 HlyC/CorC family transporter [Selenomonas caprae]SFI18069.1 Hemolysin, contains CBS domains [Selenomonas ruminantium]